MNCGDPFSNLSGLHLIPASGTKISQTIYLSKFFVVCELGYKWNDDGLFNFTECVSTGLWSPHSTCVGKLYKMNKFWNIFCYLQV